MALNFLPSTSYADQQAVWSAFMGAADFWDSAEGNNAAVGGLTLGFDTTGSSPKLTVSGYGLSFTLTFNSNAPTSEVMIAATDKSILMQTSFAGPGNGVLILDKNSSGEWGAAAILFGASSSLGYYIAPDAASNELTLRNTSLVSASLTQLVPMTGRYSTWVMENAFVALSAPNSTYVGKMELNGVKYVMAGRAAISYTD